MLKYIHEYVSLEPHQVTSSPVFFIGITIIILILVVWASLRKMRTDLVSVFTDENGAVQITPQALKELVRKSSMGIPGIHSPTTSIIKTSGHVRLKVRLNVDPECNVKDVRSSLQKKLEDVMINNLNFSNFSGVDIIIRGFQDS